MYLFLLFLKKKYLFIWLCRVFVAARRRFSCGMWDLVPWPGIKLRSLASGARSLSPLDHQGSPYLFLLNDLTLVFPSVPRHASLRFFIVKGLHFSEQSVLNLWPHILFRIQRSQLLWPDREWNSLPQASWLWRLAHCNLTLGLLVYLLSVILTAQHLQRIWTLDLFI